MSLAFGLVHPLRVIELHFNPINLDAFQKLLKHERVSSRMYGSITESYGSSGHVYEKFMKAPFPSILTIISPSYTSEAG